MFSEERCREIDEMLAEMAKLDEKVSPYMTVIKRHSDGTEESFAVEREYIEHTYGRGMTAGGVLYE